MWKRAAINALRCPQRPRCRPIERLKMSAHNARNKSRRALTMLSVILTALAVSPLIPAQDTPGKRDSFNKSCSGLHAGIRAQIISPYTETPSVMLTFVLLNDSDAPVDVESGSWRILIDGSELKDSGMIIGNGPMPMGGYRILNPGESYEFGKALPIVNYFLPNGPHRVSWKGNAFRSPTITVLTTPASH